MAYTVEIGAVVCGVLLFPISWKILWFMLGEGPFNMDVAGEKGTFLPLLTIYLDIAKVVIGLASTSITILIGFLTLPTGKLSISASSFAPPMSLLALCIIYGVLFMPDLVMSYEAYRHQTQSYSRYKYSRVLAFAFCCLVCLLSGYVWLVWIVATKP